MRSQFCLNNIFTLLLWQYTWCYKFYQKHMLMYFCNNKYYGKIIFLKVLSFLHFIFEVMFIFLYSSLFCPTTFFESFSISRLYQDLDRDFFIAFVGILLITSYSYSKLLLCVYLIMFSLSICRFILNSVLSNIFKSSSYFVNVIVSVA